MAIFFPLFSIFFFFWLIKGGFICNSNILYASHQVYIPFFCSHYLYVVSLFFLFLDVTNIEVTNKLIVIYCLKFVDLITM